ncbi:hypothetical protein HKD37_U058188 [Glycine soja]
MAKPGSPTNLASAIICFLASKKFPIDLKASLKVCKAKPSSTHPSVMVHVHEFFKVCLAVKPLFVTKFGGTLDILLVDCLVKITPKFIF